MAKPSKLRLWAEYSLAAGLFTALRYLPLGAGNGLARAAASALDVTVPKLRRVARKNLAFALPDLSTRARERIIDGVFENIARLILTMAKFPSLHASNVGEWIAYDGLENYLNAKAQGRGVLVATAHLGNWELSAYAHALMTEPMNVMVRPLDNPMIDELVESRRTGSGNKLVYKKDAARAVLRALKAKESVGILIDQNTAPEEGVFIQFFGKAACAGTAFVKLAYHSGAPVVPGFALWDERARRYILRFYPAVPMSGDVRTDTQRIHSFFEKVIREHPEQWMWIHRRWKTRPPGEPGIY